MADKFHNKLWECEFDNIVSKKEELQDMNTNQLKLEVYDTSKNDEKTTDSEPINIEDVINKAYFDEKVTNTNGHLSFSEKDYNE